VPTEAVGFQAQAMAILAPAESAMRTVQGDVQAIARGKSTDVVGLYVDARIARDRFKEAADALARLTPQARELHDAHDQLRACALDRQDAYSAFMKWLVAQEATDLATYQSEMDVADAHLASGMAELARLTRSQ
jgi:hypothetical protein